MSSENTKIKPGWIKNEDENYFSSQAIDSKSVLTLIESQGYELLDFKQIWRHGHGALVKDNNKFFFKIASTKPIGKHTRNEVLWNENIFKNNTVNFQVPKIIKKGNLNDKFYYISQFIEAPSLGELSNFSISSDFSNCIQMIARSIIEIHSQPSFSMLFDFKDQPEKEFLDTVKEWSDDVKEHKEEVKELLEVVRKNFKSRYYPALNHGDLTPWHIHWEKGKDYICLIDAEHARSNWPMFYDLAYLSQRLIACCGEEKIAFTLIKEVFSLLKNTQKEIFKTSFVGAIAARAIGGFWDLENLPDQKNTAEKHMFLKELICSGKILDMISG